MALPTLKIRQDFVWRLRKSQCQEVKCFFLNHGLSLIYFCIFVQNILVASRIRTRIFRVEGKDHWQLDHHHGPRRSQMLPEMEQPNGNPPKLNLYLSRRIVAFNFENSCPTKWATCQKNWTTLKLFLTWMRLFGDSFFGDRRKKS